MVKQKAERDSFIEENLGLVHSICKRFSGKGIEYDDLFQAGCVGLIKATDAFDETRGLMFSTYAVPVIMGEVRRLFRDGGAVKVSRSVKELGVHINRKREELEQKLNREPAVSEIAEALGVASEEVAEAVCALQSTVSLTYTGEDGIKETDLPIVFPEEEIATRLEISSAIERLNEEEKRIVDCRFFKYMTQSKTASVLNMSQVQVSRAEKKILLKLKGILK
ncbi:MAG: sigma-70 family RNA polymerase sigma factor [Clostridia bacterium]|nr:sigma-70 family RNA polymerase sigma factor [Clostridia bacterium]